MQKFSLFILCMAFLAVLPAQSPALIGYWQNWNDGSAPYIQLDQIDSRYNVIEVSFAIPGGGTDYSMTFAPDQVSQATLISQIQTLKSQNKKVLISIGGASAPVSLDNTTERDVFVSTMGTILNTYGFDGIDIDLEGSSVTVSGGTVTAPTDAKILNLIFAIKKVMENYRAAHGGTKLMLTMAPETAFVQGGQSAYGGIWGAYLPVIHALRDSLDILQVQLYNSGSMYGIDGGIYNQGTADFIVAMTEAVIQGFNTVGGGVFAGIPANKVAIALPACPSAGGGYTAPAVVASAINYLRGVGPRPGTYTRVQAGGYPNLRGMMTWSVNWDKVTSCNATTYEYAQSFQSIFAAPLPVTLTSFNAKRIHNTVAVWWETSEEANVDYYQLEHSLDGITFNVLGKVAANNTGIVQQHYEYTHANPNPQLNYYRLNIVDTDGSSEYSNVISLTLGNILNPFVFPNPVASQLQLHNRDVFGHYRISNMQGKIVQEGEYIGEPVLVNMLSPGIYYLSVDNQVSKFIKE